MDVLSLVTCIGSFFQLQHELAVHVLRHAYGTSPDRWVCAEGFDYLPLNPEGVRLWLAQHQCEVDYLFCGRDIEIEVIRTRNIRPHLHRRSHSVLIAQMVGNDAYGAFRFEEKIVWMPLMENQMIVVPAGTVHGFTKMSTSCFYLIGIHSPSIAEDDVQYL